MANQPSRGRAVLSVEDLASPSGLRRAILRLAGPVLAEMSLMTVTQIVDMAMVSRLGPVAIAGIGLINHPFFLAMGIFMGLSVGTTAVVARYCGAGDHDKASDTARQSLIVAIVLALAIVIPAYRYAEHIIVLMGGEPDVVIAGSGYLRALIPGIVFMMMRFVIANSLRGAGDTRTPMMISILVNLLNVFFNWILIFGNLGFPALGVIGAGYGTSIARSLGGLTLLIFVLRPDNVIRILPSLKLEWQTIASVSKIGIPAALERLIMSSGQIFYVRIVAGLGTVSYAAHAIAINAESISFMPAFAFAQAATTLVGQNLGAKQPEAASRSGWECVRLGSISGIIATVLLLAFPHLLMQIYTSDPELIAKGSLCLRIMGLAQVPLAVGMIFPGALRGAGDTKSVLVIAAVCVWGIRLGLAYILVIWLNMGLAGAWIAMAHDWIFRSLATGYRFYRGRWKEIKID